MTQQSVFEFLACFGAVFGVFNFCILMALAAPRRR